MNEYQEREMLKENIKEREIFKEFFKQCAIAVVVVTLIGIYFMIGVPMVIEFIMKFKQH